jgi:dTDP-4-amino-4,6-dideoxygalactose transaminase
LAKLDAWTEARRAIASRYRDSFGSGPVRLLEEHPEARGVYHLAVARVSDRERVQKQLESMGVQTGIHYPTPCHQLDPYRRFTTQPLPVAEQAAREVLSLPMFPHMTNEQVERVCEAVDEIVSAGQSYVA